MKKLNMKDEYVFPCMPKSPEYAMALTKHGEEHRKLMENSAETLKHFKETGKFPDVDPATVEA